MDEPDETQNVVLCQNLDERGSLSSNDCESGASYASSDDSENGGSDASDKPLPPFDEAQLLADCFHDFGDETLPGSTTTKPSAIIMVMSFLTAYG